MTGAWHVVVGTISAGSIPTWALLVVALFAAWSFRRGGGSTAIKSLEEAGRVLERRVKELETEGAAKDSRIAELQGKTDVTLALTPMFTWAEGHERRAQERHESSMAAHAAAAMAVAAKNDAMLAVLEMIAAQLPSEPNGGLREH